MVSIYGESPPRRRIQFGDSLDQFVNIVIRKGKLACKIRYASAKKEVQVITNDNIGGRLGFTVLLKLMQKALPKIGSGYTQWIEGLEGRVSVLQIRKREFGGES